MTEKTIPDLEERIALVAAEAKPLIKEKRGGLPYKTTSYDDVLKMLKPLLGKYGINFRPDAEGFQWSQDGNRTQVFMNVRFQNVDAPVDYILVPSLGFGVDSGDKGPGKAITYAVKQALLRTFMLETGDDPDTVPHQDHRGNPRKDNSVPKAKEKPHGQDPF